LATDRMSQQASAKAGLDGGGVGRELTGYHSLGQIGLLAFQAGR
jgi:hypothetical protein